MPAIPASQLATFKEVEGGNLEVTLERFGSLTIRFPGSAQAIRVAVERRDKESFQATITTTAIGDEAQLEKLKKKNKGKLPEASYFLGADGRLGIS